MTTILLFLPFLLSIVLLFVSKEVKQVRLIALLMGVINAFVAVLIFANPLFSGELLEIGGWLRIDRFSALIGLLISLLYFFTVIVSHRYIGEEYHEKILTLRQIQMYFVLLPIFAIAMLVVVSADNLGVLWLALEATTLATTPLVAIYKKEGSLEAAWKYIILCSLGISLGLLGIFLISYAGMGAGLDSFSSLSLESLKTLNSKLSPAVMQWAFLFSFIGIGTKVGFFPMHTWLPDAHGRTPSPISAMLSGILLNVALYALIRIKFLTDTTLDSSQWTNQFFLIFGILSVVSSAFYLYLQHHYKRMLAYSSIEHMGILAISIGLGPLGIMPALMHMCAHTFAKSLLFFASGEILLKTKTAQVTKVKNLFKEIPLTGILFIVGLFALLAVPPFATFSSEILILAMAVKSGHLFIFFVLLLALTLVCVSLLKHAFTMFALDDDPTENHHQKIHFEKFNCTHFVMILQILILIGAGIFMLTPTGFQFFTEIAKSITI